MVKLNFSLKSLTCFVLVPLFAVKFFTCAEITFSLQNENIKGEIIPHSTTKFILLNKFNYTRTATIGCSAAALQNYSDAFTGANRDGSWCPNDVWLLDMATSMQRSNNRKRLFINIGFNKGYNFAQWLNIFAPITAVNPPNWFRSLNYFNITDCGNCNECRAITDMSGYNVSSDVSDIVMVGVDLNIHNIHLISKVVAHGQSTNSFNLDGITLLCVHGAGSNQSQVLKIPSNCLAGDELCRLTSETDGEDVLGITVDNLVNDLIRENYIYKTGHYRNNNLKFRGNLKSRPASVGYLHPPLVDLLQIDTEGHDPSVIQGAAELIRERNIRCIIFEYNTMGLWVTVTLGDVVQALHEHDFDCYYAGVRRLWPITGNT